MAKYHLKIDGQGYLIVPGSYRRAAPGSAPWRWWWQRGFRGGEGLRWWVEGERWRKGLGVEISGGAVELGYAAVADLASAENGFAALLPYGVGLYAASSGSGKVYEYTAAWIMAHDTGKASLRSLGNWNGKLHVGSGADGDVVTYDGAVWALAFTVAGAAAIAAICPYEIGSVSQLYLAAEYAGAQAKVHRWNGSALAELYTLPEGKVEAMVEYDGCLYVATSKTGGPEVCGGIYRYDGRVSGGEWTRAAWLPGDYVAGMAVFDGLIYCGAGYGQKVYAFDGSRLVEGYDFVAQGLGGAGSLKGIAAKGGRLYVGYKHPTDGAAVLAKLSAGAIADRGVAVVAGGGRPELGSVREGWYTPVSSGVAGPVTAVWGGYFARSAAGAATIYRWPPAVLTWRGTGNLELGEWRTEGEEPFAVRRVVVEHDSLRAGESVAVYASVDGAAHALVGTSNVVGATAAVFEVAAGTKVRRLGIRLDLATAAPLVGGPTVRGVGVEWAPVGEVKRRWQFDVRCEGVPGVPLRLLDGSAEAKTGAQLSAALWGSRVNRGVTFEDLDGVSRDCWLVELVESLAGLDQGRGAQTHAACGIVEG